MEWEHPKKRRRRMGPRTIFAARLLFDEHVQSDAAAVSPDLWADLTTDEDQSDAVQIHLALTPAIPFEASVDETSWTVLPAVLARPTSPERDTQNLRATVLVAPDSPFAQSFLRIFDAVDHGRPTHHVPKQIDVRVAFVEPATLDSVYVTVEKGLLQKVDEIQSRFGGGFHGSRTGKSEQRPPLQHQKSDGSSGDEKTRLTALVRKALSQLAVVHSGDVFPLPLPNHPITHVRPAPAIAMHCEPVLQGKMSPNTQIILIQAGSSQERAVKQLQPPQPIIEESIEDTADETSNDQFFSAAEDRNTTSASEADSGASGDASDSDGSADESDESSDESMEDIISLTAPTLPPQQSGTMSAMSSATPRPGDRRGSGVHTPGSVYSVFTSATARTGSRPGKVFRTEALIKKIPKQALHPKPSAEDDEEAFVFVDTATLNKIGCFSGDWVRIEAAKNISTGGFPSLGLNGPDFGRDEDEWRAVRIYGLTNLPNQRPRYSLNKTGARRSSFSSLQSLSLTPTVYLSPLLLSNMNHVSFVKVGILPKAPRRESLRDFPPQAKSMSFSSPPLAKEVNLMKILTPFTKKKELEPILFSSLKRHFESRKRILKKGDVLAVAVDKEFGRTTYSSTNSVEDPGFEEGLAAQLTSSSCQGSNRHDDNLAWFRVEHISTEPIQDLDDIERRDAWGGVASIDPFQTRLSQSGGCHQSISPSTLGQTRFWLEPKLVPKLGKAPSSIAIASDLPPTSSLPLNARLRDLVRSSISPRAIDLGVPPSVILLHSTQRQTGKSFAATSACSSAGVSVFTVSAYELLAENSSTTGGGDVSTEGTLRARAEEAVACGEGHTALLIQHIDVLSADRIVATMRDVISSMRVIIATTTNLDKISPSMRSLFTHEIQVSAPDEAARELILHNTSLTLAHPIAQTVSMKSIALQTAALVAGDLVDVICRADLARSRRLLELALAQNVTLFDLTLAGGLSVTHLLPVDFTTAISSARSTFSDAIGAPKIPAVTWDDVGGLAKQKDAIMETISLPLTHPELFASGIRKRSGILFYGPPGTGKTLLAKAIATEFSLNFFSIKGPELLNMYIGESEANVRRVFQRARDARPCVVFFDELDSVAPKRGNQGDSGGVMDRIVSQLLAELDGMSSGGPSNSDGQASRGGGVFVIGATNRPDLLDPALLRPGRFDKMLYLGVASDHDQQVTILQALTRKFTLSDDVDLKRVARRLPLTYTGADLYALCSDAMLKAITRKTKAVDRKVEEISQARGEPVTTGWFFDHIADPEDTEVIVSDADFIAAQAELVGSVSAKELDHFERIRRTFESQDIGAEGAKDKGKGKGKAKEVQDGEELPPLRRLQRTDTQLPIRPAQPAHDHNVPSAATATTTATTTAPKAPNKGKGRAESFTTANKGKGKQRSIDHHSHHPHHHQQRSGTGIGNPDSGPESSSDDDMRIKSSFGRGPAITNGTTNGKGKAVDGPQFEDVDGDDEGLYD